MWIGVVCGADVYLEIKVNAFENLFVLFNTDCCSDLLGLTDWTKHKHQMFNR